MAQNNDRFVQASGNLGNVCNDADKNGATILKKIGAKFDAASKSNTIPHRGDVSSHHRGDDDVIIIDVDTPELIQIEAESSR